MTIPDMQYPYLAPTRLQEAIALRDTPAAARPTDCRLPVPYDRIADFCREHNIAWLALFGSVIRDDFTPESDIDIIADFLPHARPGLNFYSDMPDALSEMFGGRRVDLREPISLSKYFIDEVLDEAEVIYVAQ